MNDDFYLLLYKLFDDETRKFYFSFLLVIGFLGVNIEFLPRSLLLKLFIAFINVIEYFN